MHRYLQICLCNCLQDVVMEAFLMAKGCHGLLSTCSGELVDWEQLNTRSFQVLECLGRCRLPQWRQFSVRQHFVLSWQPHIPVLLYFNDWYTVSMYVKSILLTDIYRLTLIICRCYGTGQLEWRCWSETILKNSLPQLKVHNFLGSCGSPRSGAFLKHVQHVMQHMHLQNAFLVADRGHIATSDICWGSSQSFTQETDDSRCTHELWMRKNKPNPDAQRHLMS